MMTGLEKKQREQGYRGAAILMYLISLYSVQAIVSLYT